jgi:hypothetical protein
MCVGGSALVTALSEDRAAPVAGSPEDRLPASGEPRIKRTYDIHKYQRYRGDKRYGGRSSHHYSCPHLDARRA